MSHKTSLMWFRQDLRIIDNPAFVQACQAEQCLAIYIVDQVNAGQFQAGAASKIWLYKSLQQLNQRLGGKLMCYQGDPLRIIEQLVDQHQIDAVYWNRCYTPWQIMRDKSIKQKLTQRHISCNSFNGSLLWEPWTVLKRDGSPYKVFTPYYRKGCLSADAPRNAIDRPQLPKLLSDASAESIGQLGLVDSHAYSDKLLVQANAGELVALQKLDQFIEHHIESYQQARDFPGQDATSMLSPHLHFGEISPQQIWWQVNRCVAPSIDRDHFLSELAWREFSYYLLYHFPKLPTENLQAKFDHFKWHDNEAYLMAWCHGRTGYPMIDAGMRQLWQTGWMHNRVRMLVGSFLVKNLLLHWRDGERWFWDCLFDADLASNSASWQWVAGCGADAAPYFRIFNPITQGQKFDPNGDYIRRFIPEIAGLPNRYVFSPWQAPQAVLAEAGIILGQTYPSPIVDLSASRAEALARFAQLKGLS